MRQAAGVLAGVLWLSGCMGAASEKRVSSLEQRQADTEERVRIDERRAAHLRAEQIQRQRQLAVMNQCLAYAACEAKNQEALAAIHAEIAECTKHAAEWHACDARKVKKAGKGAAGLCLLAAGIAIIDGGMSALAACGGAAVVGGGVGYASAERCGPQPAACSGPRIPNLVQQRYPVKACGQRPHGCDEFGLSSL